MANPIEREEIFLLLTDRYPVLFLASGYERNMRIWRGQWWNDKLRHTRDEETTDVQLGEKKTQLSKETHFRVYERVVWKGKRNVLCCSKNEN